MSFFAVISSVCSSRRCLWLCLHIRLATNFCAGKVGNLPSEYSYSSTKSVLFENHQSLFSVRCTLSLERTFHGTTLASSHTSLPHLYLLLHMAVHHHHFLHHHHYLSLLQSFIPNLRLGFLANPFHHRPFPYLSD